MKKLIMATVMAITMIMAVPTVGMAATKNYISADKAVKQGAELIGSNAPVLTLESSSDHTQNLNFSLNLSNAEWLYEDSGSIETGINYTVLTSQMMMIEVDFDLYSPETNDIKIPIHAKIDTAGLASVTIDPMNSTVSAGTYTFAHVGYPGMSVTVSDVVYEDRTFDISFKDDYPYALSNGRLFKLTLSNGYVFDSFEDTDGTGKFSGIVDFQIEPKNKGIAYVKITQSSAVSTGTMKIEGIKVSATDKSNEGMTHVYVEPVYGEGGTITFPLTSFNEPDTGVVRTDRQVLFTIGKTGYVVDEDEVYTNDMTPFVDVNGRTMLPIRALANAFNIEDEDIDWNDELKTVKLTNKEGKLIVITIDSTELKVGAARVTMDTTAVIKEDRTYLPMRAVLNALGIEDEDIAWDDKEKTVLVFDTQEDAE